MSVTFIIKFDVSQSKKEEFIKVMRSVKEELPKVKGCIAVNIHQGMDDVNQFTLVEQWDSKESHKFHVENIVKLGGWDSLVSLLACEPTGYYCRVI